jgi:hypothetical protein
MGSAYPCELSFTVTNLATISTRMPGNREAANATSPIFLLMSHQDLQGCVGRTNATGKRQELSTMAVAKWQWSVAEVSCYVLPLAASGCLWLPLAAGKTSLFFRGWAVSSAVERLVYTEDVGSSILSPPTTSPPPSSAVPSGLRAPSFSPNAALASATSHATKARTWGRSPVRAELMMK